jgi:hypothetical protein
MQSFFTLCIQQAQMINHNGNKTQNNFYYYKNFKIVVGKFFSHTLDELEIIKCIA